MGKSITCSNVLLVNMALNWSSFLLVTSSKSWGNWIGIKRTAKQRPRVQMICKTLHGSLTSIRSKYPQGYNKLSWKPDGKGQQTWDLCVYVMLIFCQLQNNAEKETYYEDLWSKNCNSIGLKFSNLLSDLSGLFTKDMCLESLERSSAPTTLSCMPPPCWPPTQWPRQSDLKQETPLVGGRGQWKSNGRWPSVAKALLRAIHAYQLWDLRCSRQGTARNHLRKLTSLKGRVGDPFEILGQSTSDHHNFLLFTRGSFLLGSWVYHKSCQLPCKYNRLESRIDWIEAHPCTNK